MRFAEHPVLDAERGTVGEEEVLCPLRVDGQVSLGRESLHEVSAFGFGIWRMPCFNKKIEVTRPLEGQIEDHLLLSGEVVGGSAFPVLGEKSGLQLEVRTVVARLLLVVLDAEVQVD